MRTIILFIAIIIASLIASLKLYSQDAKEIVRKADMKFNGEKSSYSEMSMTIVRPKYKRGLEFKSWAESNKNALALITNPAKEKGQTFLKSGNNMWSWNPTIQRVIKLPPAMMSQGWMGSDYSNDDILKESSLVTDYSHKLLKSEAIEGVDCYVIELLPLENADVVWGKIIMWISKDEYLGLKAEYYDEELLLVKTHLAYNIQIFDNRKLPAIMEIIPADEPGNKTIVTIIDMKFNIVLDEDFFSQQNMKQIR
jgi:outer membrane lipoprotein-sorting protein